VELGRIIRHNSSYASATGSDGLRAAFAPLSVANLERYPRGAYAASFLRRPLALYQQGASGGKSALRHNKRMHATADTNLVMLRERLGGGA
jgi:hypothetical protein